MTPKQVFKQTMPFCWLKLGLGLLQAAINIVLFAIFVGIGFLIGGAAILIMALIWLLLTRVTAFVFSHYLMYMAKAGHVAVIATGVAAGKLPENVVDTGKAMVKERFATANVYFVLDKLVSGAVKQLQAVLEKVGDLLGAIPMMGAIVSFAKLFIGISLGYIDECCLGYTFLNKEQNAFKSAADGVVIYAQNIKALLKSALPTAAIVLGLQLAVMLLPFILFMLVLGLFMQNFLAVILAIILSSMVASAVRNAFIDSWILCKMMTTYMNLVPTTTITFDLYGKLSKLSSKFRELFNKGSEGEPQPAYAAAGASPAQPAADNWQPPVQMPAQPAAAQIFTCGSCGGEIAAGSGFCNHCGSQLMPQQ